MRGPVLGPVLGLFLLTGTAQTQHDHQKPLVKLTFSEKSCNRIAVQRSDYQKLTGKLMFFLKVSKSPRKVDATFQKHQVLRVKIVLWGFPGPPKQK